MKMEQTSGSQTVVRVPLMVRKRPDGGRKEIKNSIFN
jgi:hypothetical protein